MKKLSIYIIILVFPTTLFAQQNDKHKKNKQLNNNEINFDFDCNDEDACNIVIHNGLYDWVANDFYSGGQEIEIEKEETFGAITIANKNDTDGDGIIDNLDVNGVVASPVGRNEIDLMRLDIRKPIPDNGGFVTLSVVSGNIKLWENPNKTNEIILDENNVVAFLTSELDNKTIFIEAIATSASIRDIVLKSNYGNYEDVVTATAIWINKTNVWRNNTSTPIAGEGVLSNLDADNLLERINDRHISDDGRRYGEGTFFSFPLANYDESSNDKRIGGRILFEYQVLPIGIENSNLGYLINFDITRQKKNRLYKIISGGTLGTFENSSINFPWEGTSWQNIVPVDNEKPNDDGNADDEDNTVTGSNPETGGFLYSWDIPSSDRYDFFNELLAFKIDLITFKEFARIKFMFEFDMMPNLLEGSRCSDKVQWHCAYYVKRVGDNLYKLDKDINAVSASFPVKMSNFAANGNVTISSGIDSPTQRYRLIFDFGNWRLEINDGSEIGEDAILNNDGSWTISYNSLVVTILNGSISYQNGDAYSFSVFHTANPNGKQNEINIDNIIEFDVTIDP